MKDGSDAIADWPILNALLNTASGASWVSFHHGGGVGIGNSLHAGQVLVADGTPAMRLRIERVLDQRSGHRRGATRRRGLREARATARRHGIKLPMSGRDRDRGRATAWRVLATCRLQLHDVGGRSFRARYRGDVRHGQRQHRAAECGA